MDVHDREFPKTSMAVCAAAARCGADQELASHLEEEMEEREYHAARRELGNIGLIKEDTRAMWGCT
jgi:hypothetical protein